MTFTDMLELLEDDVRFVETWLVKRNLSVDLNGQIQNIPVSQTTDDILVEMEIDYKQIYRGAQQAARAEEKRLLIKAIEEGGQNIKPKSIKLPARLSSQDLALAMRHVFEKQRLQKFSELKSKLLQFNASPNYGPIARWLKATIKNPTDLDIAAYAHFIWQVKRKLAGLPIEYEMMINILGPQGAGKTFSTRRLCSPLGSLVAERRLQDLLDERNFYSLSKTFINIFEELVGAQKTDIDALKALMSKDKSMWRMLGRNAHGSGQQNCTFIATSNTSLLENFYDPTGMRRFYEVEFLEPDQVDRAHVNGADIISIWHSVDHTNSTSPIRPYLELLSSKQEELRRQSSIELFFEEYEYETTLQAEVKVSVIYKHYVDYCQSTKQYPVSLNVFSKKIKAEVFKDLVAVRRSVGIMVNLKRKEKTL